MKISPIMTKTITMFAITLGFLGAANALEVGDTAPCVVLEHYQTNAEVTEHCIRDHAEGQTHTILEFFSITCSACAENLPKVKALADQVAGTATTRLVSIDRKVDLVKNYVEGQRDQITFEVALDFERDAKKAYGVISTPTVFVLDQNNVVVYKHEGVFSPADVEAIKAIVAPVQ